MTSARRPARCLAAVLLGCLLAVGGLLGCAPNSGPPEAAGTNPPEFAVVDVEAGQRVDSTLVAQVRTTTVSAVRHLRSVWEGPWSTEVDVLVLPDAASVVAAATSVAVASGQVDQLAAVAVLPLVGVATADGRVDTGTAGRGRGRLLVNAELFGRLSDVGREVVVRHEVAHLASAAATPPDLPVWLVEGFADAVARSGLADDPSTAAVELATEVRSGRLPTGLPTDEAFAGADGRLAQTYQQAWLACRLVVDRVGLDGLVHLYRAAGSATSGSGPAVATTSPSQPSPASPPSSPSLSRLEGALVATLGYGIDEFTRTWQAYLHEVLLGPR